MKIGACDDGPITEHIAKTWIKSDQTSARKDRLGFDRLRAELEGISKTRPAYFVFYEVVAEEAAPTVELRNALRHHDSQFSAPTICGDSTPAYPVASRLVWHDTAFQEVLDKRFQSGNGFP
jgi:hypothetical protein